MLSLPHHIIIEMDTILCLVISSMLLYFGGVCGISLSQQPILTLKDENGHHYDCVDFYKQPAFSHPLLKNQNVKVKRPSVQELERKPKGIGLKSGGCPIGSVPILRVNATINQSREPRPPPAPPAPQEHCVAVVQTTLDDSNKKFYGSAAAISLHKPIVKDVQWTSSRIKLSNGQDSIEAGWMVNPSIFKDNDAHVYAKFQAGGNGCVNLECPGFVQVSKDVALGVIPQQYSGIGSKGVKYTWTISIEKHSDDGHWWVIISNSNDRYSIGYWPKSIFTSLAEDANQVEWGGEISNPGQKSPPPEMGNSMKASYDTDFSAFFRHVTVDTSSDKFVDFKAGIKKVFDCPQLYTVLDAGYRGDYWGRLIYYGGFH